MVVAKDEAAYRGLAEQFRRHAVDRRYLALVRGSLSNDHLVIEAPLERQGARIVARATTGKAAETDVEVRERFERATLVEARPRTGRTHQIRVHLSSAGHPILGDRRYGGGGDEATRLGLTRPFLHSWFIAFDHPVTGERVELEEPLPAGPAEGPSTRAQADRHAWAPWAADAVNVSFELPGMHPPAGGPLAAPPFPRTRSGPAPPWKKYPLVTGGVIVPRSGPCPAGTRDHVADRARGPLLRSASALWTPRLGVVTSVTARTVAATRLDHQRFADLSSPFLVVSSNILRRRRPVDVGSTPTRSVPLNAYLSMAS